MAATDFHLISLPIADESEQLRHAIQALEAVDPGETAFLSEWVASTPRASGKAFVELCRYAKARHINIVTSLNLGGELAPDLPAGNPSEQYGALAIFTRYGAIHVPQGKIAPQPFERSRELDGPGIGVAPYPRLNRVPLEVDESVLDARFILGADLFALQRFSPAELACDLLVVLGQLPLGGERVAHRLLGRALEEGAARTALLVSSFDEPASRRQALCRKMEEVLDATESVRPREAWSSPRALRSGFHVFSDKKGRSFPTLCALRDRKGRIAVPESSWKAPVLLGTYPITVML